jgi:hypothetical protein
MKMFLFFSHTLTAEQIDDAKSMGVIEFVKLSQDLQERLKHLDEIKSQLDFFGKYIN